MAEQQQQQHDQEGYPDESEFASVPVQRQAKRGTDLWPLYRRLVADVMRRPGQSTGAYRHIVKALETPDCAHSAYVQLWPFIIGTLLRQGEAREQGEDDSDSWGAQVLLAGLLPRYDIDSNLCSPWMHRIYHLIASNKTPDALKVTLLEYLGTSQSGSYRLAIIPFLTQRMQHETNDKARSCAILVLYLLRWSKLEQAHQAAARVWCDAEGSADGNQLGVLSKFALALLCVGTLEAPPASAIEHATALMIDDSEVATAWRGCVPGTGNRLLEATTLDASRNSRRSSLIDGEAEGQVNSPSPAEVGSPFVHILHRILRLMASRPAKRVPVLCAVVEAVARGGWTEAAFRCLTDVLVIALMPEPMPAGTYIDELEAENQAAVPVLRQLARDPRFEQAWALWQRSELWAARGLPNTQAAAMQFVSTEIPPQLAGRKWLPSLSGLERETDYSPVSYYSSETVESLVRGLASRWVRNQASYLDAALRFWFDNQAREFRDESDRSWDRVVPWVVYLLTCECVPDKPRLVHLLRAIAGVGQGATIFSSGGWDPDSLESESAFYGTVGRHMDTIVGLLYAGRDDHVRLRTLSLMEMYPGLWRTTLPHLVAVFKDVAHQPPDVRIAALAAMSYVTPIPWRRNDDDEDKPDHEEADAFLQTIGLLGLFLPHPGVKPLKSLVAVALAGEGGTLSNEQLAGLPEELQSLLMSLGLSTHPRHGNAFPIFQTTAAEGVCRLVFRARGWSHGGTFSHAAPPQPPTERPEAEVKLLPLLPGALHLLQKSQRRIYRVYSTHLGEHRPDQLAEAKEEEEEEEYAYDYDEDDDDEDDDDDEWI